MEQSRWVRPATVKVSTDHVTPIVSYDDAVRVQHGYNFKDEGVSEELCLSIVLLQEELNCPVDHVLRVCFTRVNP